jgi:UDP-GlcNAc:undecaprenyl-phosphate/decaprenyl-phosphate GlcNAc-1-phosphate transferase
VISTDLSTIVELSAMSAAATGVICFFAPQIGRTLGVMDKPDGGRKLHARETPLIGGIALLVPAFIASLFYCLGPSVMPIMLTAIGAATAAMIIGVVDDRKNLSPLLRVATLAAVIIAVMIADPIFILHTLAFRIFGLTLSVSLPNWLAAPFVLFIIMGFVNAANMADGMNGQLLGSVILWSAFIIHYLGMDAGLPFILLICSAVVTFAFNLRGRLFAGSCGAYAASLFIGLGAIAAYRLANGMMAAQVPVYWFWLPVIDCMRLMVTRTLEGKSPFAADRNHFHHMLLNRMRPRNALIVYLGLLGAPGIAAMLNEEIASITLLACVVGYVLFVATELRNTKPADSEARCASLG